MYYVPVHDVPLPVKPLLQVHVNEPMVFAHTAFELQVCIPIVHSSVSTTNVYEQIRFGH